MAQPGGRAAFQYPAFRRYLSARFLITVASEMQSVAVGWQIYSITHRPIDLGLVGLAQFVPGILLFLAAGHAADHFPRKRILQICYAAFGTCSILLIALSFSTLARVWPIYVVLLMNGVVRAFNGPASQSLLPLLVRQEHFANAVAWGSSIFQAATVLGPVAGGVIYGIAAQPFPVYLAAALGYGTALFLIAGVDVPSSTAPRPAASLQTVLHGIRYIWENKLVLGTMSLDLFAVLLGGAVALLPVYAREILKIGPYGLGVLRSAPGFGAVLTAIIVAHWPLKRRAGMAMLACVFAFGLFTILFGLSTSVWLSLIALVLAGAADMVSVIVRHTLIQLTTPDHMRGRVSAVNMIFIGASNEVGQFESGLTAQWFGAVPAVVLGGAGTILVVLLWAWCFPALRRVNELDAPAA